MGRILLHSLAERPPFHRSIQLPIVQHHFHVIIDISFDTSHGRFAVEILTQERGIH